MMILNKRIKREFKENWFRYGALFFLIVLCISIVVGMSSATDSVFNVIDKGHEKNHVEDGEFNVFVPFSDNQVKEIEKLGVKLEENFYFDMSVDKDQSKLRIFKNREFINTVDLDEGALADDSNEIVIEKLYASSHGLKLGDTLAIGDEKYTVTGIGSAPDYAYVKKTPFDVAADAKKFGIAFVSDKEFERLLKKGEDIELCYSYRINGNVTDKKLKNYLLDMSFDESMIKNKYMKEIVDEVESKKQDLVDGVGKLADGSTKLKDGINALKNGANDLKDGTYELQNGSDDLKDSTKSLNDGLHSLTKGLGDLNTGMGSLNPAIGRLYKGSNDLYKGSSKLYNGSNKLYKGSNELYNGSQDLYESINELGDGATELQDGIGEMRTKILDFIDQNIDVKYVNLTYFIPASENPRINDVKADSEITKQVALFAGVIVLLLLVYMISVFITHNIEKESAVIGALYSLGYLKRDLLKHFMILPIILVTAASIVGTVLGYFMIPFMNEASGLYSFPSLQSIIKPYAIIYGLAVPIVIAVFVNFLVINKKLSLAPLKLLRKEKKQSRITNVDLGNMGFINRYRIRQLLREIRGNVTIVLGLFLAILLMVFAFDIKGTIDNYVKHTTDDAKYEYMYILQYPQDKVPEGGVEAYTKSIYAYLDIIKSDMEVSLLGIKEGNPYFSFKVNGDSKDVYISNSVAYKFGYKVGDNIVLNDHIEDKSYSFRVAGIVPYSNGLYIFMDMDNMRKVFGNEKNYYNTILSDKKLNIESGRIASVVTVNDLADAADKFNELIASLMIMLLVVSIIVFILVLYLLLKMMVDKATFSISLIKVFGFNEKEVKKIYLGSAFYTVILSSVIGIPLSAFIVDAIWPYMISNVAAGFESFIPVNLYLVIIGIILVSYFIVNLMVSRHLKKVSLVEILKDRE